MKPIAQSKRYLTPRSGITFVLSIVFTAMCALITPPQAVADDVDIYTQVQSADTDDVPAPVVVLTLDLNLSLSDILCSNILNGPTPAGDGVTQEDCNLLQQVTLGPILANILGVSPGQLLQSLQPGKLVDFVTGLPGGILKNLGQGLSNSQGVEDELRNRIKSVLDPSSASALDLRQIDVVRLLLYQLLHQLVGVKLAIFVNHANTCSSFDDPRRETANCSNGAYMLLPATELLEGNIGDVLTGVLSNLGKITGSISYYSDCHNVLLSPKKKCFKKHSLSLKPPPFQGKEVYYEIYRYLTGEKEFNAPLNRDDWLVSTDSRTLFPWYVSSDETVAGEDSIPPPNLSLSLDSSVSAYKSDGITYNSPLDGDTSCSDVHIINLMLTNPKEDDNSDQAILASMPGINTSSSGGFGMGDMASYLDKHGFDYNNVRHHVKSSYLLNGPGSGGIAGLLGNLSDAVTSLPLGLNPLAPQFATTDNLRGATAISASLGGPQPLFNRSDLSRAGNALYYGMFRTPSDDDAKPRWRGNLKRLHFSDDSSNKIFDANQAPAIGASGTIKADALTDWTDATNLPKPREDTQVTGKDGGFADRGGAGMFLIPPYTTPEATNPAGAKGSGHKSTGAGARVFYEPDNWAAGESAAPLNLDTDTVDDVDELMEAHGIDADATPGHTKLDTSLLLAYARGFDTDSDSLNQNSFAGLLDFLGQTLTALGDLIDNLLGTVGGILECILTLGTSCDSGNQPTGPQSSQWVMGDVLHSDPLAIDYGDGDVRIFTGTNRGFLHEFRDAPQSSGSQTFAGQEVWRFMPRQMLLKLQQWRNPAGNSKHGPYGVDGAPVAWIKDADYNGTIDTSGDDHVYLYFGLRRGGNDYYALDVTDPDAKPKLLWHIAKTEDANSDFAELGMTFSTPRVGKIRTENVDGTPGTRTVLIFGGGYDTTKDRAANEQPTVGSNDSQGNAIYVVDATTGELIWKARGSSAQNAGATTVNGKTAWDDPAMTDSIPSTVTTLDTTGDGLVDRLYVGDTGGRVWRVDMGNADPAQWKVANIADLGRHDNSDVANDRRFFERPDVVHVAKDNQNFYALVIGSGNRADPLNRNTVNYLYVIKDKGDIDTSATPISQADLTDFSENCASADNCLSLLDTTNVPSGWKMRLGPAADTDRAGEKALSSPITIAGNVLFTSYVPPSVSTNACTPQQGTGRMYAIDLLSANGVLPLFAQDGEPDDSVSKDYARGTTMATAGIPGGLTYIRPQTLLSSDFSLIDVSHKTMWRTYWRERDGEH